MNANVWDASDAIEALLAGDGPVDPKLLSNADVDLGELAGSTAS